MEQFRNIRKGFQEAQRKMETSRVSIEYYWYVLGTASFSGYYIGILTSKLRTISFIWRTDTSIFQNAFAVFITHFLI